MIATKANLANAIRFLTLDAIEAANSGHPGMPLGMADVATVLYGDFLRFNPRDPKWPNRDRLVLSAGHGCMLLYSLLYLTGDPQVSLDQLKAFRKLGSLTAGHPEYGELKAVEASTGPLGQGLAMAVGMAIGERIINRRLTDKASAEKSLRGELKSLIDHKTYVIASDGDLMEGISQEAISLAGHLRLNKLVVLFDDNQITIDGNISLTSSDNVLGRFASCNWNVTSIDGHNYEEIYAALDRAQSSTKPTLIACRTVIAKGSPNKSGTAASHGSPLGTDETKATREALGWQEYDSFAVPESLLTAWRQIGNRSTSYYQRWQESYSALYPTLGQDVKEMLTGGLPQNQQWKTALYNLKQKLTTELTTNINSEINTQLTNKSTRQLSQTVLETILPLMPNVIGGSADLSGSNNTKVKIHRPLNADNFSGNYIHYGIREHAMGAIMNGLSLYGGFIAYGGTFLVFSDYLRPALRLSALMEQGVIYVLTHDSIGLGEDGPTHQPIEQLASLRAIPNLNVFRPADGVEVLECWQLALENRHTPSILVLSRQGVTPFRRHYTTQNLCARGGYVVAGGDDSADVATIIATGSELGIALDAHGQLKQLNINSRVVSLPCWRLFDQQEDDYKQHILGRGLRVAVEAAGSFGWGQYLRQGQDCFVGMGGFGASAPALDLYENFGITAKNIVKKILRNN